MTFLHPALRADQEELARFECARPERQFEIDVQEFVRGAIGWLEDPEGVDREVLVLEDSGEIIGIVMHEDDDGDRFINALAIRSDQQAKGYGKLVLGTVPSDLAQRYAGHVATWLVAPANFASHAMSDAVGAVRAVVLKGYGGNRAERFAQSGHNDPTLYASPSVSGKRGPRTSIEMATRSRTAERR